MKRRVAYLVVFALVLGLGLSASAISATVLLPDGSPAPFAQVSLGEVTYLADAQGKVEIPGEGKALVSWLGLEEELTIAATMKFSHRLLYGPPYDELDWILSGTDNWQFDDEVIAYTASAEGQATLDDEFDDFLVRFRVIYWEAKQWNYLRVLLRTPGQYGWEGYGLSLASFTGDYSYFVRFEGAWNQYTQVTPAMNLGYTLKVGEEYEIVMVANDTLLSAYIRQDGASEYTQLFSVEDDSPESFFYGGLSFINSFVTLEVSDLIVVQL